MSAAGNTKQNNNNNQFVPAPEDFRQLLNQGNSQRSDSAMIYKDRMKIIGDYFDSVNKRELFVKFYTDVIYAAYSMPSVEDVWMERYENFSQIKDTVEGRRKLRCLSAIQLFSGLNIKLTADDPLLPYHSHFEHLNVYITQKNTNNPALNIPISIQRIAWKSFFDTVSDKWSTFHEGLLTSIANKEPSAKQSIPIVLRPGMWGTVRLSKVKDSVVNICMSVDQYLAAFKGALLVTGKSNTMLVSRSGRIRNSDALNDIAVLNQWENVPLVILNPKLFLQTKEMHQRNVDSAICISLQTSVFGYLKGWANRFVKNLESANEFVSLISRAAGIEGEDDEKEMARIISNFCSDLQLLIARGRFQKKGVEKKRDEKSAKLENSNVMRKAFMAANSNPALGSKPLGGSPPTGSTKPVIIDWVNHKFTKSEVETIPDKARELGFDWNKIADDERAAGLFDGTLTLAAFKTVV
jgi:hypothetical protein